jgi:hypothetical protein
MAETAAAVDSRSEAERRSGVGLPPQPAFTHEEKAFGWKAKCRAPESGFDSTNGWGTERE